MRNFLASLCSWEDLFECHFAGNTEDRFSRVAAHIILAPDLVKANYIYLYREMKKQNYNKTLT